MTGGNYIKEGRDSSESTCVIFSPIEGDEVGTLAKSLKIFSRKKVNLSHIESRSSTRGPGYEFMVECTHGTGDFEGALEELKQATGYVSIISRNYKEEKGKFYDFQSV